MTDTLIDFLRHGEPVGGRRFRGDGVDDPLSETGWQQMWFAVGENPPWGRIVTSPMQRCRAFAEALAHGHGIPLRVEARFREVGFGVWEGASPDEILARDPASYAAFYRDPVTRRPQGSESLQAFGARVSSALTEAVQGYPGEHLLVVTHAGVIRAALGDALQAHPVAWYRTRIDNAGLTRFRIGSGGSRLEFHNRLSLDGSPY